MTHMAASDDARSHMGRLILARLDEILQRMTRLEHQVADVADDVDALDRYQRPYGDGTKIPKGRKA